MGSLPNRESAKENKKNYYYKGVFLSIIALKKILPGSYSQVFPKNITKTYKSNTCRHSSTLIFFFKISEEALSCVFNGGRKIDKY